MVQINKKLTIAIAIGVTFVASAWQAPEELSRAIPDGVLITTSVLQMPDTKNLPDGDDDADRKDDTK